MTKLDGGRPSCSKTRRSSGKVCARLWRLWHVCATAVCPSRCLLPDCVRGFTTPEVTRVYVHTRLCIMHDREHTCTAGCCFARASTHAVYLYLSLSRFSSFFSSFFQIRAHRHVAFNWISRKKTQDPVLVSSLRDFPRKTDAPKRISKLEKT